MKKYTWLLFDADDTLYDFPRAESNALRLTLEQLGLPITEAYTEAYHRCNQTVWKEFERGLITSQELRIKRFRLFFDEIGSNADPQTVSPLYLQNLALGTHLLPGAEETIRLLKQHYRLCIVTNGLKEVQRPRLARSALADCFEHIVISDEIGSAKPATGFFDTAFHIIGWPQKQNVLIIGDSLTSDMQGGINYGIDTCWYNPNDKTTELPVTYQIKTLSELHTLLS